MIDFSSRTHNQGPLPSALLAATLVLCIAVPSSPARAQPLGEVGESCRARSDCREGLRCIQNSCQEGATCMQHADCGDNRQCRQGRCVQAQEPQRAAVATGSEWADFQLAGTHFFGGITLAPGITGFWPYGGRVEVEPAFFFALRVGVLFDRTELSIELAPKTWKWDFEPARSSLSFNASIGGLIKVARRAYWPLRFGLGLTSGSLPLDKVYMQGRVDLVGLAFQYGHLLFEINLPSTRFHTEFDVYGIWAWLFNISVTYVI